MATCKECFHYEACKYWIDTFMEHIRHDWEYVFADGNCEDFKDKTKYVEQKHGRWEEAHEIKSFKHTNIPVVQCSKCECYFCDIINNHHYMYHYCPNCGAKMDGET